MWYLDDGICAATRISATPLPTEHYKLINVAVAVEYANKPSQDIDID